ncbi:MAG: hypothetical protein GY705_12360 [Bacteroidetes bacterium]|nr:hypothetical protein [Bacteroidota bacterium]
MKRAIKYLFLLWPIPMLAYLVFINLSSQSNVAVKLMEANGLIWGNGDEQITVQVKQSSLGEQESYEIQLIGKNRDDPEKYILNIDKDMWGGGFVKAVQANEDPEMELIAWGIHEERVSFLLEHHEGEIRKTLFENTSQNIKDLASEWRQAHVVNGMTLSIFVLFATVNYILIGMTWLIIRTVNKCRKKN